MKQIVQKRASMKGHMLEAVRGKVHSIDLLVQFSFHPASNSNLKHGRDFLKRPQFFLSMLGCVLLGLTAQELALF